MVLILMIIVVQLFQNKIKLLVKKHRAHIGISLDGDADRIIISDEKGNNCRWRSNYCNVSKRWKRKKF